MKLTHNLLLFGVLLVGVFLGLLLVGLLLGLLSVGETTFLAGPLRMDVSPDARVRALFAVPPLDVPDLMASHRVARVVRGVNMVTQIYPACTTLGTIRFNPKYYVLTACCRHCMLHSRSGWSFAGPPSSS
jgi:hypothetical protein